MASSVMSVDTSQWSLWANAPDTAGTTAGTDPFDLGAMFQEPAFLSEAAAVAEALRSDAVWPGRHCSPRHRMPFNSRNEGSKCVSMTW